jgi:hypothetical protein
MDQQTYYRYAWTSLAQGMHIFHLVLLHLASYLRLRWFLDRVGDSMGYGVLPPHLFGLRWRA